jgi:uncharacterized protein (DUF488 family)
MPTTVFTIGHSTHPLSELVQMLAAHGVTTLADVRTIAKSRHNPQYMEDALAVSMPANGIRYVRLEELGGLRRTTKETVNGGWRNASFRGYADYMQTPEFVAGIDHLLDIAREQPTAIMCAEAVPWRCHRSLIADALSIRGIPVEHILSATRTQPHALTPFAQVHGARITYPADQLSLYASSLGVSAVSVAASQRRTLATKRTRTRKGGPKPARP